MASVIYEGSIISILTFGKIFSIVMKFNCKYIKNHETMVKNLAKSGRFLNI